MLKRLAQIVTEDTFSKKNIREKIINDMVNMNAEIEQGVELVNIYKNRSYYKAKNKRILNIKEESDVIVIEIFIKILQLEGEVTIQNVVGSLAWLGGSDYLFDNIKTVSELLTVVCETDVYDITKRNGRLVVVSNFRPETDVRQYIADTKYLPPLVCKPMDKNNNMDSAYLSFKQSNILGKDNHHEGKQGLDALNIAQSVALSLDLEVLKEEEVSKKPLDTKEKKDNFNRMVSSSKKIYEYLINEGNKFWFDWRFDKRGRICSSGYYVNIQGNEYRKAMINLHKKEIINGI